MSDGENNIAEDFTPEPIPENETPEQAARRISKGEKKFKRAMGKMGMKPVEGITRVTLKTNKNFILYIDAPEVMKAPGAEESYIVFGEAKFLDFSKNAAASQIEKLKKAQDATPAQGGDNQTATAGDDSSIPQETINTLIEYTSCTKEQAVEALKKTNGDLVEAISLISG